MANVVDLTTRETEILKLVSMGLTNRAIAHDLYIKEKTVEFHLNHIYTKIGARTRLMAGLWAMEQGIAVEPGDILK